ncbi:MAG: hydroxymethylglutaryl-CoA reductase [Armatimonadota bacterium]
MTQLSERANQNEQWSEAARRERLAALRAATSVSLRHMAAPFEDPERLQGQIENFIGVVGVPVGVAGPLAIRGAVAEGVFNVPLATTEGTLVLAVTKGAEAISAAGGARVHATQPRLTRAPVFAFESHERALAAAGFVADQLPAIRAAAEATTRHGRLLAIEPLLLGRRLVLELTYATGDAAGQNMVTFATEAACRWLREHPVFDEAEFYSLESSASLDKKSTTLAPSRPRGRRVNAEVTIARRDVERVLGTSPDRMARVAREGVYVCTAVGAVGAQAQFANVLAALLLATGQDVATVVECSTGLTVIETTGAGALYASVTLHGLVVGTVGGGTRLATQHECLEILGCAGPDCATKLAEIVGAAVLAGELGLVAALASDRFASAHAKFGRPAEYTTAPHRGAQ